MKSPFSVSGKVIVVTGAGGLLGREFCRVLLEGGAEVVGVEIDRGLEEKTNNWLSTQGVKNKIDYRVTDITNAKSIENLVEEIKKDYNHIDGLVNNAYPRNRNYGKKFEEVTQESFCENVSMNLGGYFEFSKVVARVMTNGNGSIINIGSIYGSITPRFEIYRDSNMTMPVEYSVIKSGLIHLSKYMAKYFFRTGIRVNCISPGGIYNSQNASFVSAYNSNCATKGMLNPEDVSATLFFLMSDASKFITGQNIIVDDGFSL